MLVTDAELIFLKKDSFPVCKLMKSYEYAKKNKKPYMVECQRGGFNPDVFECNHKAVLQDGKMKRNHLKRLFFFPCCLDLKAHCVTF